LRHPFGSSHAVQIFRINRSSQSFLGNIRDHFGPATGFVGKTFGKSARMPRLETGRLPVLSQHELKRVLEVCSAQGAALDEGVSGSCAGGT